VSPPWEDARYKLENARTRRHAMSLRSTGWHNRALRIASARDRLSSQTSSSAEPSPGGRSRRWRGRRVGFRSVVGVSARHLLDLPEGYHTTPRAQAWQDRLAVGSHAAPEVPRGRALPGRGDGASAPRVVARRSIPGADHVSVAVSRWHPLTRIRSSHGTGRHGTMAEGPPDPPSHRSARVAESVSYESQGCAPRAAGRARLAAPLTAGPAGFALIRPADPECRPTRRCLRPPAAVDGERPMHQRRAQLVQ
jgi:hypothetical protein